MVAEHGDVRSKLKRWPFSKGLCRYLRQYRARRPRTTGVPTAIICVPAVTCQPGTNVALYEQFGQVEDRSRDDRSEHRVLGSLLCLYFLERELVVCRMEDGGRTHIEVRGRHNSGHNVAAHDDGHEGQSCPTRIPHLIWCKEADTNYFHQITIIAI